MTSVLRFQMTWGSPPGETAEVGRALAWGEGILYVAGVPAWFVGKVESPEPVARSWIELLEFLSSRWLHLTTEQTYPRHLTASDPRELREEARRVYGQHYFENELPDGIDEEVYRFEGRHDLARALRGMTLPSVFLMREGDTVLVSTDRGVCDAERQVVFRDLEAIGDSIAKQLSSATSERAKAATDAWSRRGIVNPTDVVYLASGGANVGSATLDFWELAGEAGADSELAAAARFAVGATGSSGDLDDILRTIRQCPVTPCGKLDELAGVLKGILDDCREKDHFEHGYALALALRTRLSVPDNHAVDVERILSDLHVPIIERTLSAGVDAVGCWGKRHGPAIVLNVAGRRSGTSYGRRFTLAHELCHLVADRATALPLAEVMGGASPYLPERRANAFGAEFLLPRWQARNAYKEKGSVAYTLPYLMTRFRVGRVLAAAQLKNASNTGVTQSEKAELDRIVQEDRAYTA